MMAFHRGFAQLEKISPFQQINSTDYVHDKAYLTCVGHKNGYNGRALINQMRLWNSTFPIIIAHCNELQPKDLYLLNSVSGAHVMNVCEQPVFGLDGTALTRRLRSYFCKSAALLLAPVKEVMLVDLDVIWFSNPESLFLNTLYEDTGTLFFRDRFAILAKSKKNRRSLPPAGAFRRSLNELFDQVWKFASTETIRDRFLSLNLFGYWRYIYDEQLPNLLNFQESSVVLLNKSKHPQMLAIMAYMLPQFSLGWGDKEIYWIAGMNTLLTCPPRSFTSQSRTTVQ